MTFLIWCWPRWYSWAFCSLFSHLALASNCATCSSTSRGRPCSFKAPFPHVEALVNDTAAYNTTARVTNSPSFSKPSPVNVPAHK